MTKTYVGIDVSKDFLDLGSEPETPALRVPYDDAGLDKLIARLREIKPVVVVFEATGNIEFHAVSMLFAAGIPVAVINPRQVRDFARAMGKLAKTDTIDAQSIAHFAATKQVAPQVLPSEEATCFAQLVTRRRQVIDMIVAEKNRHLVSERGIEGPPDLLVEILSANRSHDEVLKRALYARFGVPEYWLVDPRAFTVEVLRRDGPGYVQHAFFRQSDTLVSPSFDGRIRIPLAPVFAPLFPAPRG